MDEAGGRVSRNEFAVAFKIQKRAVHYQTQAHKQGCNSCNRKKNLLANTARVVKFEKLLQLKKKNR